MATLFEGHCRWFFELGFSICSVCHTPSGYHAYLCVPGYPCMALCLKRLKFDAGVVFKVLCRGSFCQKEITEWEVAYGRVQNKSASLLAVEN